MDFGDLTNESHFYRCKKKQLDPGDVDNMRQSSDLGLAYFPPF